MVHWAGVRSGDSASLHLFQEPARTVPESKLFEQLFEQIVRQCVEVGLVQASTSQSMAASWKRMRPRRADSPRAVGGTAQVNQTVRQYLVELEQQNPVEEPVHQQDQVSTTDPDSTYATKGGTPARLGYYDNYLVDNHSCVIVGVQATAARMSQETVAAQDMLTRFAMARTSARIGGGRHDLRERGVLAMVGGSEHHSLYANPRQYPQKEQSLLRSRAVHLSTRKQPLYLSRGPATQLRGPQSSGTAPMPTSEPANVVVLCAKAAMHQRSVSLSCHPHGEPARQRARELANTPEFAHAQRERKKVEALFAELEESDRAAPLAPAQTEVRAGAVLPGSGGPEHQATGAVPQPTHNTYYGSCRLARGDERTRWR